MENVSNALVICVIFWFCFFFFDDSKTNTPNPFLIFWKHHLAKLNFLGTPSHNVVFFFLDGAQCIFGVVGEFPRIFFLASDDDLSTKHKKKKSMCDQFSMLV